LVSLVQSRRKVNPPLPKYAGPAGFAKGLYNVGLVAEERARMPAVRRRNVVLDKARRWRPYWEDVKLPLIEQARQVKELDKFVHWVMGLPRQFKKRDLKT